MYKIYIKNQDDSRELILEHVSESDVNDLIYLLTNYGMIVSVKREINNTD